MLIPTPCTATSALSTPRAPATTKWNLTLNRLLLERIGAILMREPEDREQLLELLHVLLRAQPAGCRRARHDRRRAAGLRAAGARHHGAARADGRGRHPRLAGKIPAADHRIRALALSGDRREQRRRHRHPAGEGSAALLRRRGIQRARHAAPGGVHSGIEAAQRAAQGFPPHPQSHRDRRRRVRRRRRAW